MKENPIIRYARETFVQKAEGKLLDNYDILKQLGKGGYGKVYEVRSKKTGEVRACKHLSKLNIKNLEKFRREIEILKKLDHPNIIKLYEVFESERSLYLIMEECKGGEIFDRIIERIKAKQMYSERDAAIIFQQVMSCIAYCHNHNICHRDLKPENLLYLNPGSEKDNRVKVIDFGLSQYIREKLNTKVGTAYYVSPEILKGDYTEKCDIWSAGVILYIFLSGDPPFNGPNDNEIYQKISKLKFSFPDKKWKSISKEAKDLISHMITPEKERYTAKQVLEHPWFKNASSVPLNNLNFDPNFFKGFARATEMKKISLLYIASRLDENEISNLRKVFKSFDKCEDGQITYDELKQGLIQFNPSLFAENEIKELFGKIDVDKNGKIDYTEFLAATVQESNYLKKEKLFEVFSMFDKDNSGYITKDEILKALKAEKSQEKEVEKCIQAVDKDGDGRINYKEFLELMGAKQ